MSANKLHPLLFGLALQQWQYFVTLTFDSRDAHGNTVRVPEQPARMNMLFAFLRLVAQGSKTDKDTGLRLDSIPWKKLEWCARQEEGEANGRKHFHILISNLPLGRLNQTERYVMKANWSSVGGGYSDVRLFDAHLSGVRYVLKGLVEWSQTAANSYEMAKFGQCEVDTGDLILANSLLLKWATDGNQRGRKTEGTGSGIPGLSLSGVGNRAAVKRTKETPLELESRIRSNWLNSHPAGVSFVR